MVDRRGAGRVGMIVCTATMLVLCAGTATPVFAQTLPDSHEMAERMLSAIGGRNAWARVSSTFNDSQQNRLGDPTVVRTLITMEFERQRFRIETTAPDLHLIRVVDHDRSWRLNRQGRIESLPGAVVAEDLRWYAGHVYRTIQRIAKRDPALSLTVHRNGRLEVYERDARIAWLALDARGEPYAFGAHDDDTGSICGPWDFEVAGIRHPIWVSRPDGSWRAMLITLEVNPAIDHALFARPDSANPGSTFPDRP